MPPDRTLHHQHGYNGSNGLATGYCIPSPTVATSDLQQSSAAKYHISNANGCPANNL